MRAWILALYLLLTTTLAMVALIQVFPDTDRTAVQVTHLEEVGEDGPAQGEVERPASTPSAATGSPAPGSAEAGGETDPPAALTAPEETADEADESEDDAGGRVEWRYLDELEFGEIRLFGWTYQPEPNSGQGLLVLALLSGLLGSFVHAGQSLASYVGNQTFKSSWILWYVLRGPIGAALGVLIYFVLRAGLLSGGSEAVSPYGVATLAALGGLFSKQATDKLAEVFDRFFSNDVDAGRKDKLTSGKIAVRKVEVATEADGSSTLTLTGSGFAEGMTVVLGTEELSATVTSDSVATVTIPAGTFAAGQEPKALTVKVGDETSEPVDVALT